MLDSAGRRKYGGHSLRVTGARFWVTHGLEVFKVQIFARWGSNVILRCVSDCPIANLTGDLTASNPSSSSSDPPAISRLSRLLNEHVERAASVMASMEAAVSRLGSLIQPATVLITISNTWHKVLTGWWYGCGSYQLAGVSVQVNPGTRKCDRCFPDAKRMTSGSSCCSSK